MQTLDHADFDALTVINAARQRIRDALGDEAVRDLHRQNRALDALALVVIATVAVLNTWALVSLSGWLLLPLVILQGWLFQWAGLVSHDLFVHRRVGGETLSRIGALLLTVPRLSSPVGYEQAHLTHHRHMGSSRDSEHYKQGLDTRQRRLLFSTLFGIRLAQNGKKVGAERSYHDVSHKGEAFTARAAQEKWVIRLWLLTMVALTIWQPLAVALAYWAPLLIVAPVVNTVRIVLEHADADISSANAFQFGTAYRTGLLTRVAFLWDSGDCHLIHHIFPRMPYYRVGRCVDLLDDVIRTENPRQRHNLLALLKGWYIDGHGHRTPWPKGASEAPHVLSAPQHP